MGQKRMKITKKQFQLLVDLYVEKDFDHKRFYSEFYSMIGTYVGWALGHAYLLPAGKYEVEKAYD